MKEDNYNYIGKTDSSSSLLFDATSEHDSVSQIID